jgi:CBS domain-containing protein
VVATFEKYDRIALPVTDSRGVLVGMITVDDVLDVAEQKATEEIHGLGGVEALEAPYFDVSMGSMVKKRGGWLSALFLGEMLTATAMSAFEDEIAKAVVLSLFLPLIISSGGNSGSQATSIIIRSPGAAGGEAAGLVAGGEPRGGVGRRAGAPAGVHRPPSHRHLGQGVPPLWGALRAGGDHGGV